VLEINNILAVDGKMINSFLIFLIRQHQLARWKPCLLRLSTMRILPIAAVHKKKAMHGGALTFQILFQGMNYTHLTLT
jgi:hypothetical protein